jgi:single-strand DNA-binding protein
MADINHVVLVGRLTRDAEIKYTNSGTAVSKFGLAVNRRRKSGDQWTEEANFFDCVVWGRVAEALTPYLVKGKQVGVQGELRQNRWEQDGQRRSKVEVNVSNIQLLGGRPQGSPQDMYQGASRGSNDESAAGGGADESFGGAGAGEDGFDDDIPF